MKNFSKKSTFPLFESICLLEGVVQHPHWHEKRYRESYQIFYNKPPKTSLFEQLKIPLKYQNGRIKLRIAYNENERHWDFIPYVFRPVAHLQLVENNTIDYGLKFENRTLLEQLFRQRGACDDILIIKNELLTDTSYGNIAFEKKGQWFTPAAPLLNGTARARLIAEKKIIPIPIRLSNYSSFERFKMLNALRDFDADPSYDVNNIKALR
jgi:4-amino-4-deoxychorismate lyase